MDSLGQITGLANLIGTGALSASKAVVPVQNNASLLSSLADNTVLRGVVQSKGANNTITLRTEAGTLTLQTDVFLKRGAEVAIKIEQKANDALIRIISVNGQSLTKYLEGTASVPTQDEVAHSSTLVASAPLPSGSAETASATADIVTEDAVINATLRGVFLNKPEITADSLLHLPAALQVPLQQATTGTSLQIQVLAIAIPLSESGEYIPLSPYSAGSHPSATSPATAPLPGYGITPAQRIAAEPYLQTVTQNQQAALSSLTTSVDSPELLPVLATGTDSSVTLPLPRIAAPEPSTPLPSPLLNQPALVVAAFAQPSPPLAIAVPPASQHIVDLPLQTALPSAPLANSPLAPLPTATQTAPLILQPLSALSPQSSAASPQTLSGTVIQNTVPRELTVQTSLGTIKLFVNTPLPKGSIIQFELQQVTQVRQPVVGSAASADEESSSFPSRLEAMETIAQLQRPAAMLQNPFPAHLVPRPGPALGAELLFMLTALKGGNLRSWLGEEQSAALEALGRRQSGDTKGDMLSRLEAEFSGLKTLPDPVNDGVWRSVFLPIFDQGQVQPLQYFLKKQQHKDEQGQQKDTDHFMVDVELTRMGRMQLDGLVQKLSPRHTSAPLQFDLIIRTQLAWSEEIRHTIREIYRRGQEISGFRGTLTFRHGPEALVPLPIDKEDSRPSNTKSILV